MSSYLRKEPMMDKCQKILKLFQEIGNKQQTPSRHVSSHKNNQINGYFFANKNTRDSSDKKKSFFKENSTLKKNISKIQTSAKKNQSTSSLFREKSNSSFISYHRKQSRLDKIMKLKTKPCIYKSNVFNSSKKDILNRSLSSLNSSRSSLNKENNRKNCNKESRLQKIMNIKVEKPKVNSTLINYQPKRVQRSASKSASKPMKNYSILEFKQCKKKMKKADQIQQKQDRLWKIFERERQLRQKEKRKRQQKVYKQQRRKQEKFQKLVYKQVKKIQNSRQISLRKQGCFTEYVYPNY